LADRFVDAACLKSLGVSKIVFAVEGYSESEIITPESAKKSRNLIEGFTYYSTKNKMTLPDYMKLNANLSDMLMKAFFAGKIIDNPGMYSFFDKLEELSRQGIEIKIVGLESSSYRYPEN
jgi:hypothetical protein